MNSKTAQQKQVQARSLNAFCPSPYKHPQFSDRARLQMIKPF